MPGLEAPITAFCLAGYGRFVMQVAYTRAETPGFFGPECAQFLAHAWSAAEDDMWNGRKVFTLLERGLNGGRAPAPPPTKKVKRPVDDAEAAQSQDTVDTPSPLAPRTARAEGNGAEVNGSLRAW